MFRITVDDKAEPRTLKLEGRLSGVWVDELERSWRQVAKTEKPAVVDLTEVSFIDPKGKELLTWLYKQGVELRCGPLMTTFILSQIQQESNGNEEDSPQL